MRIAGFKIRNRPPIKHLTAERLADTVVIAGSNGVGKTRAIGEILQVFHNPRVDPNLSLEIHATNESEQKMWGKASVSTSDPQDVAKLAQSLQRNQRRGKFQGTAIYFDSARVFDAVRAIPFNWDLPDPFEEQLAGTYLFGRLRDRYSDNVQSMYKIVAHHRNEISRRYIQHQKNQAKIMEVTYEDPLAKFKEAFSLLLSPKALADIDVREGQGSPQLKYVQNGETRNFDTLSSGEKEVVNIVFDLLLHDPEDCIIFFDEPELHLHPELSFRLLKTLRTVGHRNQFIFCTHSADIISANLDNSVLFFSPPAGDDNQCHTVQQGDAESTALRLLGQNLGVISLGRRIVVVEGRESSLDRQTYGEILGKQFPSLVLTPAGTKHTVLSMNRVVDDVLSKTVWGVDFFMVADRDANLPEPTISGLEAKSKGRLRFLRRYHLENYFLDAETIAHAFERMEKPGHWLRDSKKVEAKLQAIATASIPYAVQLWASGRVRSEVGEASPTVKGAAYLDRKQFLDAFKAALENERSRITPLLEFGRLEADVAAQWDEYLRLVESGDPKWKAILPGRPICHQFASAAGVDPGRFKTLYIAAGRERNLRPFDDLISIFKDFEKLATTDSGQS